jgi:hypothetical protein
MRIKKLDALFSFWHHPFLRVNGSEIIEKTFRLSKENMLVVGKRD